MSAQPFAFISYRRADSSAASRWLAQIIVQTFGAESVFIDTESIRMADDWADRIDEALKAATLLIPVIGPSWLSITDAYSRRRIDNDDDWVRSEIRHALTSGIRILPVLLSRTVMPDRRAFPDDIGELARKQGFELRDDRWEDDLNALITRMSQLGFQRVSTEEIRYPTPKVTLRELTETQLREALAQLPSWRVVTSARPGNAGMKRTELHASYEFAAFKDAMAFMVAAVPEIAKRKHHPRWQNLWRTVSVWLTTWDIGHRPSELDISMAEYFDSLRKQFPPPRGPR